MSHTNQPPKLSDRWTLISLLVTLTLLAIMTVWITLSDKRVHSFSIEPEKPEHLISSEPILPIPLKATLDPAKVALGQRLFFDTRLSANNTISCASCHDLTQGGADNKIVATGINGAQGSINTPTVFNSQLNFVQFWDGRAETLFEQLDFPIFHPAEMGSNWPDIIEKLSQSTDYLKAFKWLYADGMTTNNIKDTLVEFEKSLLTPNSRFDQYLRGDQGALSLKERQGYLLFKSYGCTACHQGVNVGGNMFQKLGVMGDYFIDRGNITEADKGRFNVTGQEKDLYYFRVPGLRNVALTPPYLHDGSAKTLKQVINIMAKYQLGRIIPDEDVKLIEQFLQTLTGEYGGKPL